MKGSKGTGNNFWQTKGKERGKGKYQKRVFALLLDCS